MRPARIRSRPAISKDGSRLFVANEDTGELTVVAVEDGHVLATFKVGDEPEGVDLRPDGKVVYVTSEEDSQVTAIDAIDLKPIKTFKVGQRPRSTAFLPDSTRAYVTAENGSERLGRGRDEAHRAEARSSSRARW